MFNGDYMNVKILNKYVKAEHRANSSAARNKGIFKRNSRFSDRLELNILGLHPN
jgi:hypothetical protein